MITRLSTTALASPREGAAKGATAPNRPRLNPEIQIAPLRSVKVVGWGQIQVVHPLVTGSVEHRGFL